MKLIDVNRTCKVTKVSSALELSKCFGSFIDMEWLE